MKKLNYPFSPEAVRELKVGDMVLITGKLFTGRDAVHKYLHDGNKPPVNLKNQIIYHCGPVTLKDKKGKFMSYDSTAWIITKSIYAKGLRPTLFFTKPFEQAYKRLPQELVNDLKIDLEKIFNYSIKQPK